MENDQSTTQRASSPNGSAPSTNQRLAYATQRAEVLFGCYRRGDANDPDRYVAAIAAVLSLYEFELIREVTDPRTGICTNEKFAAFMPNAGELKIYCEGIAQRQARLAKLAELPRPNLSAPRLPMPDRNEPGRWANVFVSAAAPQYPRMCKRAETADVREYRHDTVRGGIHVNHEWITGGAQGERAPYKPPADMSLTPSTRAHMGMEQQGDSFDAI